MVFPQSARFQPAVGGLGDGHHDYSDRELGIGRRHARGADGNPRGQLCDGGHTFSTAIGVVFPSAFSGIAAAYILGISRAVGETMVVAVAAGMQPNLTWNPAEPAATITAFIVQVALGDLPHGSIGYQTIFAAGLMLFIMTLAFNILGHWLRKRYREVY